MSGAVGPQLVDVTQYSYAKFISSRYRRSCWALSLSVMLNNQIALTAGLNPSPERTSCTASLE